MSTPADRRIVGKITLATLGRTISAAPPPPVKRQAVPVPPPAAPRRAKAAAPSPKPTASAVVPVAPPSPPIETAEDRRVGARIAALVRARTLFADAFRDDPAEPLPNDITRQLVEAGISEEAAADVVTWWAERCRRAARQREQQHDDERVAARAAALAAARELFPDLFEPDNVQPLPHDIAGLLRLGGINGRAMQDALDWWRQTPAYQAIKRKSEAPDIQRRMGNLALLRDLAPTVFDADAPKPLAISTRHDLDELGMPKDEANELMRWWCRRREYLGM